MTKIFYWHLVELDTVKTELVNRGVGENDLQEILIHIEEIIHHRTLSLVYDLLPSEHHKEFSLILTKNPCSPEIWNFLHRKTQKDLTFEVEKNIRTIISEILNDFEFDI
jgi:hypothetical protein